MQGQFQLNVFMPVIAYNILEMIQLIADISKNFYEKCLKGIQPNRKNIQMHLERNLILATSLNRKLGYDTPSKTVKKAVEEDKNLKEAALELKVLSEKDFDKIVDPKKMISPNLKE